MTEPDWRQLLDWHRRQEPYPWSGLIDPYPIWVSETMLQQTTVPTVKSRFEEWLRRFPTLQDLAQATEEEVLRAWEGLGYYRRAIHLLEAARIIQREGWPTTPDQWKSLPGVGDYTARALSSFLSGWPTLAYDANVKRILLRLEARSDWDEKVRRNWEERLTRVFEAGLSSAKLNAALMRLGQEVCRPRSPRCSDCPLEPWCEAHRRGLETRLPPPPKRPEVVRETLYPQFLVSNTAGEASLALIRSAGGRFRGQYLPPSGSPGWWEDHPCRAYLGSFEQPVTHHRWTLVCWAVQSSTAPAAAEWVPRSRWVRIPMPSVYRRALAALETALEGPLKDA